MASFSYFDGNGSPPAKTSGKKVACLGAGSSSLACAAALSLKGHEVIVFEERDKAGGIAAYAVPEHLMSQREVEEQIERVFNLGVRFIPNTKFGREIVAKYLEAENFDAVFLGLGLTAPKLLNIQGDRQDGIYSGMDFLYQVKHKKLGVTHYDHIVIIGADIIAMDCAEVAALKGAKVTVVSHKHFADVQAQDLELARVHGMGIGFSYDFSPVQFVGSKNAVIAVRFNSNDGVSQMNLRATKAVYAVGQTFSYPKAGLHLEHDRDDLILVHDYMTSRKGVFAAGACVTGIKTIASAIEEGKLAAEAIDKYLKDGK